MANLLFAAENACTPQTVVGADGAVGALDCVKLAACCAPMPAGTFLAFPKQSSPMSAMPVSGAIHIRG